MSRKGQVFIGFKCAPELRAALIAAAGQDGLSRFIRESAVERIQGLGIRVPDSLSEAPPRIGRPKKKREPTPRTGGDDTLENPVRKPAKYPTAREQRAQKKTKP